MKRTGTGNQGRVSLLSPRRAPGRKTGRQECRPSGSGAGSGELGGACFGAAASWSAVALHRLFSGTARSGSIGCHTTCGAHTKRQRAGAVQDAGAQPGESAGVTLGALCFGRAGFPSRPLTAGRADELGSRPHGWLRRWTGDSHTLLRSSLRGHDLTIHLRATAGSESPALPGDWPA